MASANTGKLPNPEVEDSASQPTTGKSGSGSKPSSSGGRKKGPNQGQNKPSSSGANSTKANSQAVGYSEGTQALLSYNLGLSGRKERIISPFKADKFFHMVEMSWASLVDAKPYIVSRFSYAEFKHICALMLYQRLEQVKFDALGIKPPAPTRIPLPRNTRVFQPIWSVLANIGKVDDDDLRVTYIPDGILPKTPDLSDIDDVENLLACTLYDWPSSWQEVLEARGKRKDYDERIGYTPVTTSNKSPTNADRSKLIGKIADYRRWISEAEKKIESGKAVELNGNLYDAVYKQKDGKDSSEIDEAATKKGKATMGLKNMRANLESYFKEAKNVKAELIRPKLDLKYTIDSYNLSDGVVTSDPGAYGAWMHWDPRLWLEYEQVTEIVSGVALFSLSMPAETTGTYAWLLPVESNEQSNDIFCKLPKASIAPATWILSLLIQSSTLDAMQRANFYAESDRLVNLHGLRQRYIRAAIKHAAGVEQYGTY